MTTPLFRDTLQEQYVIAVAYQNADTIKLAMDKTFPERRRMIVTELCSIRELVDTYPILLTGNQIFVEFERLTNIVIQGKPLEELVTLSGVILQVKPPAKVQEKMAELNNLVSSCGDEKAGSDVRSCAALVALPLLLKDDTNT